MSNPLKSFNQFIGKKDKTARKLKEKEDWLRKNGVSCMLGYDMKGIVFYAIQFCFGIFMFYIMMFSMRRALIPEKMIVMGAAFVIGFRLPTLIIMLSNKSDNADMLPDIKSVYDVLKIQMKAGVFVTDILAECFLIVKNRRLKIALRELANQIYMKHDLPQALDLFHSKFNNTYIDMLVMTLEQSLQSGRSVQMLQDVSQQIQDVERALNLKVKQHAEHQMLTYQLAVYFGILLVVIFAMYYELTLAFLPM